MKEIILNNTKYLVVKNYNDALDEDALKENGDKFDANQKAEVEKLKDELQQALNNNDYTTLKTKLDALEQAAQQMSQAMYQQQANNSSANNSSANNSNNDYMDADFKEKN